MDVMTTGRVRVEQTQKRVRAQLAGEVVADGHPLLVWEKPYYPTYYFHEADVRTDLLQPDGRTDHSSSRGDAELQTVAVGGRRAEGAVAEYRKSPIDELAGTVRLDWDAMDRWFEEDEQVHVHARDPYKRIDVLESSRHVRIVVDSVVVADSRRPTALFETGLPVRWYLPKPDVRMDLLTPTATVTSCPYKGDAEYYTVEVAGTAHDDLAWWYRHPIRESVPIAGKVCFYDERVDVYVDGALQERPATPFARS
jgi:uncharacterized protein (DUF427 family)